MLRNLIFALLLFGFIHPVTAQHDFDKVSDVTWASPDGFDLTMDIYTPKTGKSAYPVLVIFHGGGWLINNKSIMDQLSEYVAANGEYVVCNVNYRLLIDQDNTVTMDEIIEDVFGAVLWVKENIAYFGGDPEEIAVTGDSAGGHLSEMVVIMGDQLAEGGFDSGPEGFEPSYLPPGETATSIRMKNGLAVQAAIISYGAFDMYASAIGGFEKPSNMFWQMGGAQPRGIFGNDITVEDHEEYYKMVSPAYNIPQASEKRLPPQFFTVGSRDNLTTPESVKAYVEKIQAAGHPAELWVYEGRPHAFLDSGANEFLGTSFEKDAPEAIDRMIAFLDKVFY